MGRQLSRCELKVVVVVVMRKEKRPRISMVWVEWLKSTSLNRSRPARAPTFRWRIQPTRFMATCPRACDRSQFSNGFNAPGGWCEENNYSTTVVRWTSVATYYRESILVEIFAPLAWAETKQYPHLHSTLAVFGGLTFRTAQRVGKNGRQNIVPQWYDGER